MQCGFCGREVPKGAAECPYCHYRMEIDPEVLRPQERDAFEGTTIEEDGTATDTTQISTNAQEQERAHRAEQGAPEIKVHTFGCGSGMLMTLLILGGILALFFFLLPTFVVFAAIGAVIVFIMRLFS